MKKQFVMSDDDAGSFNNRVKNAWKNIYPTQEVEK